MEVELFKATDQEGNNGAKVAQENFQTNTDDTQNAMDTTDRPQDVESTEKAQQQEHLARKEVEDVVFICIHGQAFQCKPQVGMPLTEFKRTFAHAGGCWLCSKLHTHSDSAKVQGRGDKKGKFACAECGKTFSQNASVDHPITIRTDKDKHETNTTNVDTNTVQQNTKRMNHDLVLRSTRQQKRPQVRQVPRISCQECGKVFTRRRAFDRHMKQHDKEKLNESKERDDAQNTSRNEILLPSTFKLPQHEDHASYCQMQLYVCKECPKVFNRLSALRQHQTTHPSTKSQSCTPESKELFCVKCSKAFSRPDIFKKHELLHANVDGKAVKCVLCLETLEDEIVYKAHLTRHLKQNRGKKMKCKVCEKMIKGTSTLKRHTELHNNEGQFPCRFGCSSSFASDALREYHEAWYCTLGEKLLCAFCGLLFSSRTMMLAHERKFHSESLKHSRKPLKKEFKCKYCGRIFGFLSSVRRHELTHTNEKPFKCRFCPKAFQSSFGLICHERIHTKEKPYQCEVCGRAFTQETHLRRHMRVHTGEKPYQCQKCGKSYSHDTSLALHLKNHDNPLKRRGRRRRPSKYPKTCEDKVECQYCGRLFNHRNCLINHERIHTKEKPYKCTFCGKAFTQDAHCKGHMRIHTGEKPHKCRICGKAFTISGNCRAHEKIHDKSPKTTSCSLKNSAGTLTHKNTETISKERLQVPVVYQELSEDPDNELQAADVILQLLEGGGRVANLESLVQNLSSQ